MVPERRGAKKDKTGIPPSAKRTATNSTGPSKALFATAARLTPSKEGDNLQMVGSTRGSTRSSG
jgi:hypothetical protein